MKNKSAPIDIPSAIHIIRGQRMILDADLALLYGVSTKALNQAVKRNRERFPETFAFQLARNEVNAMRSQSVTASKRNIRFQPYAFTEHGALMAANVLQSERAVKMSIAIVEAFVRLRRMVLSLDDLTRKVNELEKSFLQHGRQFEAVFEAIRQLMAPPEVPEPKRRQIGFHSRD
jgi:hypothetical protein